MVISEVEEQPVRNIKAQKNKNNVEVMTTAIAEMSQTRERIWEQKMMLEKEKLDKVIFNKKDKKRRPLSLFKSRRIKSRSFGFKNRFLQKLL